MTEYQLHEQVGHLLRRANQRHKTIFTAEMPIRLPATQFAALAKLQEEGELSQNLLGRMTAMDSATIAGVVSRLAARGFVSTTPSETDSRMVTVGLTASGTELIESLIEHAHRISEKTLAAVPEHDRAEAIRILKLLATEPDN